MNNFFSRAVFFVRVLCVVALYVSRCSEQEFLKWKFCGYSKTYFRSRLFESLWNFNPHQKLIIKLIITDPLIASTPRRLSPEKFKLISQEMNSISTRWNKEFVDRQAYMGSSTSYGFQKWTLEFMDTLWRLSSFERSHYP